MGTVTQTHRGKLGATFLPDSIVEFINEYAEISSLSSGSLTTVVTYTVPSGKIFYLDLVEFNGTNIAEYQLSIDGSLEAKKNTYFGSSVYGEFEFNKLKVTASKAITLKVIHARSETGDFNGRIMGTQENA